LLFIKEFYQYFYFDCLLGNNLFTCIAQKLRGVQNETEKTSYNYNIFLNNVAFELKEQRGFFFIYLKLSKCSSKNVTFVLKRITPAVNGST